MFIHGDVRKKSSLQLMYFACPRLRLCGLCHVHTLHFVAHLPPHRVIVTPAVHPRLVEFRHFDVQSTGQKSYCVMQHHFRPSQCFAVHLPPSQFSVLTFTFKCTHPRPPLVIMQLALGFHVQYLDDAYELGRLLAMAGHVCINGKQRS